MTSTMAFITTAQQQDYAAATILSVCNIDATNQGNLPEAYVDRDGDGNIIELVDLGKETSHATGKDTEPATHWDMPASISELQYLQKLAVYNCRSLPATIGNLTSLRELSLHFCSQLRTLPIELGFLPNLTDLRIHGDTAMNRIILFVATLPNLKFLYYHGTNGRETNMLRENMVQDLLDPRVQFNRSLQILNIEGGDLLEDDVVHLLAQVLPSYPNLQRIIIPNNLIRSLTPIVQNQPDVIPPSIRLRQLNLLGNPVLHESNYDSESEIQREQRNLLKLVTLHEELSNVGRGITESIICTTRTLLTLDLNQGGRVLLGKRFRPIPLSVWPLVLERANQMQGYHPNVNVLYHLLRNGPALGKLHFLSNHNRKNHPTATMNGTKRKLQEIQ